MTARDSRAYFADDQRTPVTSSASSASLGLLVRAESGRAGSLLSVPQNESSLCQAGSFGVLGALGWAGGGLAGVACVGVRE